jgi:hypothetical protein
MATIKLKMLHIFDCAGVNRDDQICFFHLLAIGGLYRQRVELCLDQLTGGDRILEIRFGSGVTFFNLHDQYREIYSWI